MPPTSTAHEPERGSTRRLDAVERERPAFAGREREDAETAEGPPGVGGREVHRLAVGRGAPRRTEEVSTHRRLRE